MNFTMMPTEATPRYRNFSNNMPSSIVPTPRAVSSMITVEKEPERDPEEDCFMCRQANIYVKPIGVSQEQRVARRHPPPLTRAQIDDLSRKKNLTKVEARKLLQCFFPEIKDVKYFQLHKYHSCCYDPKHLKLCKNHITALQHEQDDFGDGEGNEEGKKNRVSFVRIKIEPTKGIPTRFLGPAVLPESLADMLMKQVNRLETKSNHSVHSHQSPPVYGLRRVPNNYDSDNNDDDDDEEENDDEGNEGEHHYQASHTSGQIMNQTLGTSRSGTQVQLSQAHTPKQSSRDIVVEDLDELNHLYMSQGEGKEDQEEHQMKKKSKRGKKKKANRKHRKPKLKHWEIMALEQSQHDPCNCRHHVMRLAADQVVYDWCRCKDHQHKELMDKQKPPTPPLPPELPKEPTPPPPRRPKPKKPKVQKKSIGVNATEPVTTELALAYDPSTVDYDTIQEAIYYRTASGRLIKPEFSNAFTYDAIPPSMSVRHQETGSRKTEVLYLAADGQLQSVAPGQTARDKKTIGTSPVTSLMLSKPGTLYNGHARMDGDGFTPRSGPQNNMPILKFPSSVGSSRPNFSDGEGRIRPTEFTIATFSPDKSLGTMTPGRTSAQSPSDGSHGKSKNFSTQKSTKPTFANNEPTPNFDRQSSVVANRRWFDQSLGDQNLHPVRDGQYGLIAGSSTEDHKTKSLMASEHNEYQEQDPTHKNDKNCTIS